MYAVIVTDGTRFWSFGPFESLSKSSRFSGALVEDQVHFKYAEERLAVQQCLTADPTGIHTRELLPAEALQPSADRYSV